MQSQVSTWIKFLSVPGIWLLAGLMLISLGVMSLVVWWHLWQKYMEFSPPKPSSSPGKKKPPGLNRQAEELQKEVTTLRKRISRLEKQQEQSQEQFDQAKQHLEQAQEELQQARSAREKLVRELLDLVEELHRLGQSQDVAAPLARHVLHTLFQALERSGVEVIRGEQHFDPQRHWPVPFDDAAQPGHPVAETLLPGVALDGQVLRRAEVRLAKNDNPSTSSQETSHG